MVEDVLGLQPELQVGGAEEADALEQRSVHAPKRGSTEDAALEVAEGPGRPAAERASRRANRRGVEVRLVDAVPLPTLGTPIVEG